MYVAKKNTLVVQPGPNTFNGGPTAMGGVWDSIAGGAGDVAGFLGAQQRAEGSAAALAAQNRDLTAALAAQSGPTVVDLAILGGLGYLGYRLFFRKAA